MRLTPEMLEGQVSRDIAETACRFARHGSSSLLEALRELVSNAIDATPDGGLPILVEHRGDALMIADAGTGVGSATRLFTPGWSSKDYSGGSIGAMGVGFLTALAPLSGLRVDTQPVDADPWSWEGADTEADSRRLRAVTPPQGYRTVIRIVPRAGNSSTTISDDLARVFLRPRIAVHFNGRPLEPARSPEALSRRLARGEPVWSHECECGSGGFDGAAAQVTFWLDSDPHASGMIHVVQAGVLLARIHQLAPVFPPGLGVCVETPVARPDLMRKDLPAGSERDAVVASVNGAWLAVLHDPPQPLVEQQGRLVTQSPAWLAWLANTPEARELARSVRVRSTRSPSGETIAALERVSRVDVLRDTVAGKLEFEARRLDPGRRDECTVLASEPVERLLARHLRLESPRDAGIGSGSTSDEVRQLVRLSNELLSGRGARFVAHAFSSREVLGHARETRAHGAEFDLEDFVQDDALEVVLNTNSPTVRKLGELWRQRTPAPHDVAALAAFVVAQGVMRSETALWLSSMAEAGLTGAGAPRVRTHHATVLLLAPFSRTALLTDLAAILRQPPFFAELMRADMEQLRPDLWDSVREHIEGADGFVLDLRGSPPNANVLLEYGYVLGRRSEAPRLILVDDAQSAIANMSANLVAAGYVEGQADARDTLRRELLRSGGFLRMPAPEPYVAPELFSDWRACGAAGSVGTEVDLSALGTSRQRWAWAQRSRGTSTFARWLVEMAGRFLQ